MDNEYKRYKINDIIHADDDENRIESLHDQQELYHKKALKAFGLGVISLFVLNFGLKALLEIGNIPANIDITNVKIMAYTITFLGSTFSIGSIITFISSLKNKLKIQGKIEENEYWLQEEQIKNQSRGGR